VKWGVAAFDSTVKGGHEITTEGPGVLYLLTYRIPHEKVKKIGSLTYIGIGGGEGRIKDGP